MKSYLINLSHRTDRLDRSTNELHKAGIEFERFEAISGDNKPLAFNKSQYFCIKKAVEAGHERFAIFEDDVAFTDKWHLIGSAINELPENWGLLHLGCNLIGMDTTVWQMPTKYSEHLAILHNAWQTQAIVWNAKMASHVLKSFPYWTDEYEKEGLTILDEWLRTNIYQMNNSYVMRPMVAYQRPDTSDIWGGVHTDYTSCFERGNKYLMGL